MNNLIFATKQSSSQNAFTILPDGTPDCSFYVFITREDFLKHQAETWEGSKQQTNLIEQSSNKAQQWLGNNFVIFPDNFATTLSNYLDQRYYGHEWDTVPSFVIRNGIMRSWTKKELIKAKKEVAWYETV